MHQSQLILMYIRTKSHNIVQEVFVGVTTMGHLSFVIGVRKSESGWKFQNINECTWGGHSCGRNTNGLREQIWKGLQFDDNPEHVNFQKSVSGRMMTGINKTIAVLLKRSRCSGSKCRGLFTVFVKTLNLFCEEREGIERKKWKELKGRRIKWRERAWIL